MKNIRKILRPAAALLLSLAAAGAMAGSQSVSVSIIGPGGHSNGDYGNVNAVHAAARSIMLIEKSVPESNIILLGKLIKETNLFSLEVMKKGIEKVVPPAKAHLIENNFKAIELGMSN